MTDDPATHIDPALSPAEDETEPIRRGVTHQRPVPRDEDHTPCGFAPIRFEAQCVDLVGFKRRLHDWSHESPQGTRCIFCGTLRRWEPL